MTLKVFPRITAVLLGIASTVALADRATGIAFAGWMVSAREFADRLADLLVKPFEFLVVIPVLRLVGEQELLSKLNDDWHDHWKHVFILLWLAFGATVQMFAAGHSYRGLLLGWVWAGICAFAAGLLTGTDFISAPAIIWWPLGGFLLFLVGFNGWDAFASQQRRSAGSELLRSAALVATTFLLIVGILGVGHFTDFFRGMPSPGFLAVAGAAALVAAGTLFYGFLSRAPSDQEGRRSGQLAHRCIDILVVFLGAATVIGAAPQVA